MRPSVEYGNVIWQSCNGSERDQLENIQKRAMRIITGGISRTSIDLLYEETGLELLSKRRERNLLLFFHRIMYGNIPNYLQNLKPHINFDRHNRNLRSRNNLDPPTSRIKKYESSTIPKATLLWNALPDTTRHTKNYKAFKKLLENNCPVPNDLFFIGNRKSNIHMSKLRMKCSDLKAHLFELKLIENPTCECGYFYEDSIHYFFVCPLYNQHRITLHNYAAPIVPFTLHSLLYGCQNLTSEQNMNLYLEVIKFVENSKRFD